MDVFKLGPEQFPLRAIGNEIYSQLLSSPILTAQNPDIAGATVYMLNEMCSIILKVKNEGPTLVTTGDPFSVLNA